MQNVRCLDQGQADTLIIWNINPPPPSTHGTHTDANVQCVPSSKHARTNRTERWKHLLDWATELITEAARTTKFDLGSRCLIPIWTGLVSKTNYWGRLCRMTCHYRRHQGETLHSRHICIGRPICPLPSPSAAEPYINQDIEQNGAKMVCFKRREKWLLLIRGGVCWGWREGRHMQRTGVPNWKWFTINHIMIPSITKRRYIIGQMKRVPDRWKLLGRYIPFFLDDVVVKKEGLSIGFPF